MSQKAKKQSKKSADSKPIKRPAIPYHCQPDGLTLKQWQIALRRQFAETNAFGISKISGEAKSAFGDYEVYNAATKNRYKVAFRGMDNPMNFCSCLDFKTNRLGTCKHLESLILNLKNNPKIKDLSKQYAPTYTSVYLSYKNGREVKIRIGTNHSAEFRQLAAQYFDSENTLFPLAVVHFEQFLSQAASIDADFRCYPDALDFVIDLREKEIRKKLAEKYENADAFKDIVNAQLFEYQRKGCRFAFVAGRSMIADEMGLGKTIQAIAVSQMLKRERGIERVLIICPTSLKYQWQSEIKRFTDSDSLVIEGNPLKRNEQYAQDGFYKIASYHTVANDVERVLANDFDMIVLDEAQRIKNWNTKLAKAVKKMQTPYCVVLTGTPLENKLEELYSIVQFVNPYKLGPYYQFLHNYQLTNDTGKVVGYKNLNEIGQMLADTVIRRKKSDVLLQLPDRMDKNLFVPMTEQQLELHEEYQSVVSKLVCKWQRMKFLPEQDRQKLLIALNMMRMSCDSTFLFDQKSRHDTKIGELMSILSEYFEGNTEKAVIFSQWERMTRIIAQELDALGINYEYLHGGVPSKDRKSLFDNFNNTAECRVFLSTDAGSTGLNLQAASLIINMDIPWNPAVLEQRIARIHRMGQKSSVSVLNFVSSNTIEHRMLSVLKFKTSLAQGILDNGENAIFVEDSKFNAFMKEVEQMTASAENNQTADIPTVDNEEKIEQTELSPQTTQTEIPFDEPQIQGDDDVKTVENQEPADLLSQGISFLSGLAKTLQSPEQTEKLVHSLVEKDATTGKTHLKIPVESEETVNNVLNLLGNLFNCRKINQ